VRDNYGDQELTIDKICGILGVSAAYFSTTFKKETGKTFINYLTDYRMEQAVQRLIEKDDKTYVIAAQVGYADPAYFSYVFKKKFGVSPTRYRSERK
jgi:two-component system response regulator YesN